MARAFPSAKQLSLKMVAFRGGAKLSNDIVRCCLRHWNCRALICFFFTFNLRLYCTYGHCVSSFFPLQIGNRWIFFLIRPIWLLYFFLNFRMVPSFRYNFFDNYWSCRGHPGHPGLSRCCLCHVFACCTVMIIFPFWIPPLSPNVAFTGLFW